MAVYIIEGSTPLHGNIRVHGAKNAALPVLAAALLPPESEIEGCPRLSDTAAAMNILRSLGCRVEQHPDGTAQVDSRSAQGWEIPESCMREMRSSIIFLGAILTRYGRARVSFPGGCELGPRPIDLHLAALERMGAVIREDHGALDCTVPMGRLHGAEIVLSFPSVGATQNVLIAAVLAEGRTILRGAAQEPEIDDLIRFLNGAGARIRQDFAGTLIVDGVDSLHAVRHRVIPDRIAAATYLCCAAAAGGSITVEGCVPAHLAAVLPPLEQAGCRVRTWRDAVAITVPERAVSRFSHRCPGPIDGGSPEGRRHHRFYRNDFPEPLPPCERDGPDGRPCPHRGQGGNRHRSATAAWGIGALHRSPGRSGAVCGGIGCRRTECDRRDPSY